MIKNIDNDNNMMLSIIFFVNNKSPSVSIYLLKKNPSNVDLDYIENITSSTKHYWFYEFYISL